MSSDRPDMQTSIPNYQKPVVARVFFDPDEVFDVPELLIDRGFYTSKNEAKKALQNNEVWQIDPALDEEPEVEILPNLVGFKGLKFKPDDRGDLLFVGGKKTVAICHRIVFRPVINIKEIHR